jgi:hypothetical protein
MVPWGKGGLLCVTASVNRMGGNRINELILGTVKSMSNVKRPDLKA